MFEDSEATSDRTLSVRVGLGDDLSSPRLESMSKGLLVSDRDKASIKCLKVCLEFEVDALKKFKESSQILGQEVIDLNAKLNGIPHQDMDFSQIHMKLGAPMTYATDPIPNDEETEDEVLVTDGPTDEANDPKGRTLSFDRDQMLEGILDCLSIS
nr:hypothetical protein CFP56_53759 [Quercus suber]